MIPILKPQTNDIDLVRRRLIVKSLCQIIETLICKINKYHEIF